jgi:hypothetical protein
MTIKALYPNIIPSLLLDFANTEALDPRITFARASTARYYNGVTTAKAEENLLTFSQEFDSVGWNKSNVTVSADTAAAPDGTTTADLIYPTTNGVNRGINRTDTTPYLTTAVAKTISIFAKASGMSFINLLDSFNGGQRTWFNVSTGTVGTTAANHTASIVDVGNGWYRCIVSVSVAWSAGAQLGWSVSDADNSTTATANGTDGVLLWGAQLEQRSAVTAYQVTTTQPITNYIPVLQTAAAGVARFDHNPVTGESLGLLIEEQRTNLFTYSEQFDNAFWSTFQASLQSNVAIAPDGTLTADLSIPDATSSSAHGVYPTSNVTVANATAHTLSVYAKAAGNSFLSLYLMGTTAAFGAVFNLATGVVGSKGSSVTTSTITPVGNGWYRCSMTATSTSTAASSRIYSGIADNNNGAVTAFSGDGFSGLYIWGAQLEAGAFPTSYIPTVASQVTRSADAASMTGANFSSWYRADEGTMYASASLAGRRSSGYENIAMLSAGASSSNSIAIGTEVLGNDGRAFVLINGSAVADLRSGEPVIGTEFKLAIGYKVNDFAMSFNAGTVQTDTAGAVPADVNRLTFRVEPTGPSPFAGHIRKIAYYGRRLSNAELQALTS